tara:strand:- start:1186 stop:1494 length:309 start_codon:yes stop_codon:yes gene_type:complete
MMFSTLNVKAAERAKGLAILDFGSGSQNAEIIITGQTQIASDSFITAEVRLEATSMHDIDDFIIDPIRVMVKNLVAGVGFTIQGRMDNGVTNGTYNVNWNLR